ncbi:MAG TPA: hypothetical protein VKR58_11430, partial [Aquella sp.]|nr:hypothetical protein [Aquella sp.]
LYPSQINFGQKTNFEVPNVMISFNATGATGFVNPAAAYKLISIANGAVLSSPVTSTVTKYVLVNSNDRLLTHEIDGALNVSEDNINIFRNVGVRGSSTLIRNIQCGWTYEEPYYTSAIEVLNPNGLKINFGDQPIILDGSKASGVIQIDQGVHTVQIQKANWLNIQPGLSTLATLKSADTLFPYNQKLLIEGYTLTDQNNPYIGVDTFAGYYMTQVSVVDFNNNINPDDYTSFAVDTDAIDTNKPTPSLVFMVKSDASNSDFLDELFTIRFTIAAKTFNYVKFKAQFSSNDPTISPVLSSYKLQLSS